jgi:large subunit ribosomal protein L1
MVTRGKKYQEAAKLREAAVLYDPPEAVKLAKKTAHATFDETVEVHMKMGVDPRAADQQVRGIALLPHGLGKTVRICVFAQGDAARKATEAGAEFVGADDIVKKIEEGWTDFDIAIATPDMMGKVGKLGKMLGRKGLMPNPKSGTVVSADDLPRAINDARKGRVEFRLDRTAVIHVVIGKVSFDESKLFENFTALIDAIVRAKPSGVKGQYIKRISIATTMGPGIRVDMRTLAGSAV